MKTKFTMALLTVLAVTAASCGSSSDEASESQTTAAPATTMAAAEGETTESPEAAESPAKEVPTTFTAQKWSELSQAYLGSGIDPTAGKKYLDAMKISFLTDQLYDEDKVVYSLLSMT